jgi:predicted nucleic acid-binding protein
LDAFLIAHSEFVLDWDAVTARTWGRLKHSSEVRKQPQALWDSLIDAMAAARGCTVATRHAKGFRHADTFNPWMFSV